MLYFLYSYLTYNCVPRIHVLYTYLQYQSIVAFSQVYDSLFESKPDDQTCC